MMGTAASPAHENQGNTDSLGKPDTLMPKREQRSLGPSWIPVRLWERRWWIALAALFILVWCLVPPLLYRHTGTANDARLKAITDTRTALMAGLVGVGALLTFWLNSRGRVPLVVEKRWAWLPSGMLRGGRDGLGGWGGQVAAEILEEPRGGWV